MADEPVLPDNVVKFPGVTPYLGPTLPEKCWRRGFREFRDAHAGSTEACDEFLFSAYNAGIGVVIGLNMGIDSSFDVKGNTYTVNMGASGKSRKTTSQNFLIEALQRVKTSTHLLHGISSPEGLVLVLSQHAKVLVVLNEIKALFVKGSQDSTRGLIPKLTELYDCPPETSVPTRLNPLTATKPFLSIIASTTRQWFHNSIDIDDIHGGMAGRFLYFMGPDKPPLSWPPRPNTALLESAASTLIEIGQIHAEKPRIYVPSSEAMALYDPWYNQMRVFETGNDLLDAICQRLHVHTMKMAIFYAALDGTTIISGAHMDAALAFANYQRQIHALVLAGISDSKAKQDEERILRCLKKFGWQTAREIQQRLHGVGSKYLAELLKNMVLIGSIEYRSTDKKFNGAGAVCADET